jgi:hypothetical protein
MAWLLRVGNFTAGGSGQDVHTQHLPLKFLTASIIWPWQTPMREDAAKKGEHERN